MLSALHSSNDKHLKLGLSCLTKLVRRWAAALRYVADLPASPSLMPGNDTPEVSYSHPSSFVKSVNLNKGSRSRLSPAINISDVSAISLTAVCSEIFTEVVPLLKDPALFFQIRELIYELLPFLKLCAALAPDSYSERTRTYIEQIHGVLRSHELVKSTQNGNKVDSCIALSVTLIIDLLLAFLPGAQKVCPSAGSS